MRVVIRSYGYCRVACRITSVLLANVDRVGEVKEEERYDEKGDECYASARDSVSQLYTAMAADPWLGDTLGKAAPIWRIVQDSRVRVAFTFFVSPASCYAQ